MNKEAVEKLLKIHKDSRKVEYALYMFLEEVFSKGVKMEDKVNTPVKQVDKKDHTWCEACKHVIDFDCTEPDCIAGSDFEAREENPTLEAFKGVMQPMTCPHCDNIITTTLRATADPTKHYCPVCTEALLPSKEDTPVEADDDYMGETTNVKGTIGLMWDECYFDKKTRHYRPNGMVVTIEKENPHSSDTEDKVERSCETCGGFDSHITPDDCLDCIKFCSHTDNWKPQEPEQPPTGSLPENKEKESKKKKKVKFNHLKCEHYDSFGRGIKGSCKLLERNNSGKFYCLNVRKRGYCPMEKGE